MRAAENHRNAKAHGEIRGGTWCECLAAKEGNGLTAHTRVLIDEDTDDAALFEKADHLPAGERRVAPEEVHVLAVLGEERGQPRILRFLGDGPGRDSERDDAAGEELPVTEVAGGHEDSLAPRQDGSQQRFALLVELDLVFDAQAIGEGRLGKVPPQMRKRAAGETRPRGLGQLGERDREGALREPALLCRKPIRERAEEGTEAGGEAVGQKPQERQQQEQCPHPQLAAQALLPRHAHSFGGHWPLAASKSSHSSRTAPRPPSLAETQSTAASTSAAASRGAQESAALRSPGRSLTSSPMKTVSLKGTPASLQSCSTPLPLSRLWPTTCPIASSRHRCCTRSARRPESTASLTPERDKSRKPWPSRTSKAFMASPLES